MYTLSQPSYTFRKDGVIFPQDDRDPVWQEYEVWLRADPTHGPTEIADEEKAPTRQHITVSAWQLRKALIAQNLDEQVESVVMSSGDKVMIAGWLHAAEFESDHPLILAMLPALGMTEDQMYSLFELALTL